MTSMVKRIEKLERHIPKNEPKQKSIFCLHGAHPSQEEQEIAYGMLEEMNKENHLSLLFLPYDCENSNHSFRYNVIQRNNSLGIVITECIMYKLVKEYDTNSCYHDKNCPVITGEKTSALGEKPLPNNCNVT